MNVKKKAPKVLKNDQGARFERVLPQMVRVLRASEREIHARFFAAERVTFSEARLLRTIHEVGERGTMAVATATGLSQPAVSIVVRKLLNLAMIETVENLQDRRTRKLYVTERGKELMGAESAASAEFARIFFKELPVEQAKAFLEAAEVAWAVKERS